MVSPLDQIRNRKRGKVPPRTDPLAQEQRAPVRTLPLERVSDRVENTRELNMAHVEALIDSVSAVGLITPLTVDEGGVLLAGAHRLEALRGLKASDPERFEELFAQGAVPVRMMPFSASSDTLSAIRVEVEENEKRLDYTASEVCSVADQLLSEGYVHSRGRPKEGDRPLIPALELIFGKSRATIKRYLASRDAEPEAPLSSAERVKQSRARLSKGVARSARQLSSLVEELTPRALSDEERQAVERAEEALRALGSLLDS